MWNPFNWLRKPRFSAYTPPPAPRGRRAPAVTTTQTHRSVQLNFSLFNWYRGHTPQAPTAPGRSLLDLRVFDRLFGARPVRPATTAQVQAARHRADAARARTAARRQTTPAPAPASRPATKAEVRGVEARRVAREKQEAEKAQAAAQAAAGTVVVEGEKVSDKPVPVRQHKRDGHTVHAHRREKPGEGEE